MALNLAYLLTAALYAGAAGSIDVLGGEGRLPSMGLLYGFWLVLFLFAGLYRERYAASRLEEFTSLLKVTAVGALLLFFVVFIERSAASEARAEAATYWGLVLGLAGGVRFLIRTAQKRLILRGIGVHRAVIVGWTERVEQVHAEVVRYPQAGLDVVGTIRLHPPMEPVLAVASGAPAALGGYGAVQAVGGLASEGDGGPTVSGLDAGPPTLSGPSGDGHPAAYHPIHVLPDLIERLGVQDVLIALDTGDHAFLDEVLRVCDGKVVNGRPVALKLVPDFYAVVGGMARTEHTYGLPLIEVFPVPIPEWERHTKRLLDLLASAAVLALGAPLWALLALAVRADSAGPAIFRQTRVGRHGRPFTMYKFRTMRHDAERETGPVWACHDDPRLTRLGRYLRAFRLDEIPQLWNVLRGEMSLVGPRPERPYFVERLTREIPLYSRRHRVQPGITGLAQVKWRYDQDIEDVRQKVKYDLLYIENMSLRLDFQILLQTVRTALRREGHAPPVATGA